MIDLEDEAETDVPTTLIRSKADCPQVEVNYPLSFQRMLLVPRSFQG